MGAPATRAAGRFDALQSRPPKMRIYSVRDPSQRIEAQFNPVELEEIVRVSWGREDVPGLSHQVLQFGITENVRIGFELAFFAEDPKTQDKALFARRFLQSLCYPGRGAQNVAGGEPQRALFVWPNFLSLTSVITELHFKYRHFNVAGTPTGYTVHVSLEEIRDTRLFAEDVLAGGTRRSPPPPNTD